MIYQATLLDLHLLQLPRNIITWFPCSPMERTSKRYTKILIRKLFILPPFQTYYHLFKVLTQQPQVSYTATLLYLPLITLIKTAILLDWTSLFATHAQRFFAWTCYITIFLFASFASILFALEFVNCTPVQKNWNPLIEGTCRWSIPKSVIASAAVNLGLDLLPLALAQRIIWGLHADWKRRLGVSLIFLVGLMYVSLFPTLQWKRTDHGV